MIEELSVSREALILKIVKDNPQIKTRKILEIVPDFTYSIVHNTLTKLVSRGLIDYRTIETKSANNMFYYHREYFVTETNNIELESTNLELLIDKFPPFCESWSDEFKNKWFDNFDQLSQLL